MHKLKIDPEFRDKIPALSETEFEQLKENILSDGEVYEPIVTWNDVIVDGHNRWKIICENWDKLHDKYKIRPMEFSDKWEAFEWMYRKQLGRRNLSDEQKKYMVGKMYEARKKSHGGDRKSSAQNEHMKKLRASEQIAAEIGIGKETVKRSEKFAKGVDAIRDEFPETADQILKGGYGVSKGFIASIPSMPEETKAQAIEAVKGGAKAVADFKKNATMEECNATPIVHEESYNESDFADQISGFPKELDDMIRLFLMVHGDMLKEDICSDAFSKMLDSVESVVKKYREVSNEYRN